MSPKRKKLEAALDGLFSSSQKPIQPEPDIPASKPEGAEPTAGAASSPAVETHVPGGGAPESPVGLPETPPRPADRQDQGGGSETARSTGAPVEALTAAGAPINQTAGARPVLMQAEPKPRPGSNGKPQGSSSPASAGQPEGKDRQLVVFNLAGIAYALDIGRVESIIKMQPITAVPHARPWVEGVTNLRGTVLPVIDPRKRFGLTTQEAGNDTRIMVISVNDEKIGIVVDAVSEVLRIPMGAIEPPPAMVTSIDSAFVTGMAKVNERIVILLDAERVVF